MAGRFKAAEADRIAGVVVVAAERHPGAGAAGQSNPGQRRGRRGSPGGATAWHLGQYGRGLAAPLPSAGSCRTTHKAAGGAATAHHLGQGAGGYQCHAAQAQGGDLLERAAPGQAGRAGGGRRPSHLAEVWAPAAPGRNLQVQPRPAV